MNPWNKYEVKDSTRDYWTIFFRPVNLEESMANPSDRLGSEGYCSVDWSYYVIFGCVPLFEKMTEKQIDRIVHRDGMYHGVVEWEAHIDDIKGNTLHLCAPEPERFLRHFVDRAIGALTSACHGNVIENSIDQKRKVLEA